MPGCENQAMTLTKRERQAQRRNIVRRSNSPSPRSSGASYFSSSAAVRRRLRLVGAFCLLIFGLSVLWLFPVLLFPSLKMGARQSLPFASLLRSLFGRQAPAGTVDSVGMEAGNTTASSSIVVYVTVPSREAGKRLAESLVREKLAACVNIVPGIQSVYHWEGEIQTDTEELLIIKTRQSLLEALTDHVKANHEYEVPEVISLPITGGNLEYLEWLKNSTRG